MCCPKWHGPTCRFKTFWHRGWWATSCRAVEFQNSVVFTPLGAERHPACINLLVMLLKVLTSCKAWHAHQHPCLGFAAVIVCGAVTGYGGFHRCVCTSQVQLQVALCGLPIMWIIFACFGVSACRCVCAWVQQQAALLALHTVHTTLTPTTTLTHRRCHVCCCVQVFLRIVGTAAGGTVGWAALHATTSPPLLLIIMCAAGMLIAPLAAASLHFRCVCGGGLGCRVQGLGTMECYTVTGTFAWLLHRPRWMMMLMWRAEVHCAMCVWGGGRG